MSCLSKRKRKERRPFLLRETLTTRRTSTVSPRAGGLEIDIDAEEGEETEAKGEGEVVDDDVMSLKAIRMSRSFSTWLSCSVVVLFV